MARHKPVHSGRFHGTVKRNDLLKRPLCKHCGKPMRVKTHSKGREGGAMRRIPSKKSITMTHFNRYECSLVESTRLD